MEDALGGRQVQRHAPVREQVAAIIREAIVEMRLKPGEVLIERQLCEMTGASRPSVREALRQLEAESLVLSVNGRGTVVTVPDFALARGVYEASTELEGVAAEVFVTRATFAEKAEIREVLDKFAASVAKNSDALSLAIILNQFYDVLLKGTRNEVLSQILGQLRNRVSALILMGLEVPGRPERALSELSAIVQSIEANDPAAARRAAASHAQQVAYATFTALSA
jgi:DNA-binding GntR family transcriptional regulator